MREATIARSDDAMTGQDGPLEQPPASHAQQSNGFTAVNGDSHGSSSFRPDESARHYMPLYTNDKGDPRRSTPINSTFHTHGWRPDDRPTHGPVSQTPREASPTRKRKRSISVNVDNTEASDADGRASPKRRAASTLDSAIDLTSPVATMHTLTSSVDRRQQEPAPIGPYARVSSPVARWNRGEPPPKPRPEVEASLAESVNKFHQTQQTQEIQRSPPVEQQQQQTSPVENEADQQEANASDDDEPQGENDSSDPKKARKRNFSNRTKTGCHTCRGRKKKCDERKPICGNCERGNFPCQGYGPKPPNGTKVVVPVRHLLVQPKGYDTPPAPGTFFPSPSEEAGLSYSHWGRIPPSEMPPPEHPRSYADANGDPRYPPPSRDGWHRHGWSHFQDRLPPPDYPHAPQYHYGYPQPALPPPPQHAALPISDPFARYGPMDLYHRPSNRPATVASSNSGSGLSNGSQHTARLALTAASYQPSEKDKMLRGEPFLHWIDAILIAERRSCGIAVASYNKNSKSELRPDNEAAAVFFARVLNPSKRMGEQREQQSGGPIGTVGDSTVVEVPFKCDYGYNVHLGNSTVVQTGCYLQDSADITIGDRVIIGADVKIHTLTANVESAARKGSQGQAVAGAVAIEDDVFIGANAVILPYCTIGRGAVVGAGSVVTRDVKEHTVVAGNPAKFIRSINAGSSSSGENLPDRRHAYEIQERNEKVKKRMMEYANSGFN